MSTIRLREMNLDKVWCCCKIESQNPLGCCAMEIIAQTQKRPPSKPTSYFLHSPCIIIFSLRQLAMQR